jgi:hypothetical protein
MFFRKPKSVVCTACGKPIEPKERRFVEKHRITKEERHTHVACQRHDRTGRKDAGTSNPDARL